MQLITTYNVKLNTTIKDTLIASKWLGYANLKINDIPIPDDFHKLRTKIDEPEFDYLYIIKFKKRLEYYFKFKVHKESQSKKYELEFAPGKDSFKVGTTVITFGAVTTNLQRWVENVAIEIMQKDFWSEDEIDSKFNFENGNAELNNPNDRRLTSKELEIVISEIQNFKKETFEIAVLTANELQKITDSLDFLKDTAENKKRNQVIEVLIGITIKTLAPIVGKDTAMTLWEILKQRFATSDELNKLLL